MKILSGYVCCKKIFKNLEKKSFIICLKSNFMIEYNVTIMIGGKNFERDKQSKTKV